MILSGGREQESVWRADHTHQHERSQGDECKHKVVVDSRICQGYFPPEEYKAWKRKTPQTIAAATYTPPVVGHGEEHHAEAQGEDGKIDLIEAYA